MVPKPDHGAARVIPARQLTQSGLHLILGERQRQVQTGAADVLRHRTIRQLRQAGHPKELQHSLLLGGIGTDMTMDEG